jgi:hypothetical protein
MAVCVALALDVSVTFRAIAFICGCFLTLYDFMRVLVPL